MHASHGENYNILLNFSPQLQAIICVNALAAYVCFELQIY